MQQQDTTTTRRLERAIRRTTIRGKSPASLSLGIEPVYFHPKADQDDPWAATERAYDRRDARSTVTFYCRRSF